MTPANAAPLSAEEMDALRIQASEKQLWQSITVLRLLATVSDRERQLAESEAEDAKLLEYARQAAGTRDVHSIYEVLDKLANR